MENYKHLKKTREKRYQTNSHKAVGSGAISTKTNGIRVEL